jgi:hypothetical protein
MNTNVIASSPNINGNIGSCEIKSNSYDVSSFYTRTTAVNSCTGEIINDTTYYQWGYTYIPGVIFLGIIIIFIGLWIAS